MAMNSLLSHIKYNLIHKLSEEGFKEKSIEEIKKCLNEVYESLDSLEIKDLRFPNSSLCHIPNCCKEFLSARDEVDSEFIGHFCNNQIHSGDAYCEYHEVGDNEKMDSEYIYLNGVQDGEIFEGCPYIVTNSFGVHTLCGKKVFEPPFLCEEHKAIIQGSESF